MKLIKCVVILMMFFIIIGCCSCTSLRHRSFPPAESGDPILGIAVTHSSGLFSVTPDSDASIKKGSAVAYSILDLVSFGDAGSAKASKNGEIDIIKEVNVDILRVRALWLPIFTRYTTVVTGK